MCTDCHELKYSVAHAYVSRDGSHAHVVISDKTTVSHTAHTQTHTKYQHTFAKAAMQKSTGLFRQLAQVYPRLCSWIGVHAPSHSSSYTDILQSTFKHPHAFIKQLSHSHHHHHVCQLSNRLTLSLSHKHTHIFCAVISI